MAATPAGEFLEALDGDTVKVAFRIRLAGIKSDDGTDLDKRAQARITELLTDAKGKGRRVDVQWFVGETTYRRLTAEIKIDGKDLGQILYDEGYVQKVSPRPMASEEE